MKITRIETTPVNVPRKRAFGAVTFTALGPADVSEYGIVQVHTDDGVTGLGELASVFARRGALLCHDVDERLAPAVVGLDPMDITRALRAMERELPDGQLAIAGVEMALWDIAGKALGVPVYKLLGGKMRERIPLSYSVPFGEPEQMAEFALERAREGFRTVKVKVGQGFARDVEAVRMVRDAVGAGHRVRVDANMAMTGAKEAIRLVERIEPYDPELLEQPMPARDLHAMAEIRRSVSLPIMADESIGPPGDAMEVIRREAADVLNVYVTESGGIQNAARIFTMGEQAGLACMIGSMPELGIGTAAQIHLGIAMPNLDLDSDTCGSLYQEEDLLASPLRLEGGFAYAPEGPGLGVELDPEAFERARRRGAAS